jgi:HEAT repeat protein
MADSRPVKSGMIERECSRCFQTVSFDNPESGAPLFCPICKEPIAAAAPSETTPETALWWVAGTPPPASAPMPAQPPSDAVVALEKPPIPEAELPRESPLVSDKPAVKAPTVPDLDVTRPSPVSKRVSPKPVPAPAPLRSAPAAAPPLGPGLSAAALVLGVVAFAVLWFPALLTTGLVLGSLGLMLAGLILGQILAQRRGGGGFVLAASLVNLQALVLAVFFLIAPSNPQPNPAPTAEPVTPTEQPPATAAAPVLTDLAPLLKHDRLEPALKDADRKVRQKNVAALGEVGRQLRGSVGDLAEKLNDDDAGVRAAAAEALGKIGPLAKGAYPPLRHASERDPDPSVQQAARGALDRIGPLSPADAPLLSLCLKDDPNPSFRASVAQTLLMIGALPEETCRALKDALKDRDPRVRVFAAQALWVNHRDPAEVVDVLRAALADAKDASVRAGAAYALGAIGKPANTATRALQDVLHEDGDSEARLRAAEALYLIEDNPALVLPELRKLLVDKSPATRGLAAEALGRMGPRAAPAVEDLRGLLRKDEPAVRACAAFALGGIGKEARAGVPDLMHALRHGDDAIREQAVVALDAIGPDAAEAVPLLINILELQSGSLQARAAHALGSIGKKARPAVPALTGLLKGKRDPGLRLILAQALWRIDQQVEETLPVLFEVLAQRDGRLKTAAVEVLAEMGNAARPAVPLLQETQKDAPEALRQAIQLALQDEIGQPAKDDVPDLQKALSSSNAAYRRAAAQALLLVGPDAVDALDSLLATLKVEDVEFRIAVVKAIGAIGPPPGKADKVVADLTALLKGSPPELQLPLVSTLGSLGATAHKAVPALIELLASKDERVPTAVLEALGAMGPAALKAVPAITERLKNSPEKGVRANAAYALGDIGRPPNDATLARVQEIRDALKDSEAPLKEAAFNDKEASVRLFAARTLWIVTRRWQLVVPVLKKCLRDEEAGIRATAAEFLGDLGEVVRQVDREVVTVLIELWKKDRDEVRRAAFDALKKIAPAEIRPGRP